MRAWLLVVAACAHAPPAITGCALPLPLDPARDGSTITPRPLADTIASVSLEGAPALAPLMRGAIETHTGQSLAEAPLAADLRRLWAFDVLADARVDARAAEGGIAIVFAITPEPRIAAVHGADAPALRRLRWLAGTPYEPQRVLRIAREIEAAYKRDGYLDATVAVRRRRSPALELCVAAYRGPEVTIGALTFPGAHAVAKAVLLGALHGKGVNHPGGTFDEDALAADDVYLANAYFERGMIEAKIGEAKLSRYSSRLDIAIPITEGPVFRLGTLSGLVVPEGLHRGDVFVRSKLAAAVDALSTRLDANVVPVSKLDVDHRRIDLRFDIEWREPWSALRLLHWH